MLTYSQCITQIEELKLEMQYDLKSYILWLHDLHSQLQELTGKQLREEDIMSIDIANEIFQSNQNLLNIKQSAQNMYEKIIMLSVDCLREEVYCFYKLECLNGYNNLQKISVLLQRINNTSYSGKLRPHISKPLPPLKFISIFKLSTLMILQINYLNTFRRNIVTEKLNEMITLIELQSIPANETIQVDEIVAVPPIVSAITNQTAHTYTYIKLIKNLYNNCYYNIIMILLIVVIPKWISKYIIFNILSIDTNQMYSIFQYKLIKNIYEHLILNINKSAINNYIIYFFSYFIEFDSFYETLKNNSIDLSNNNYNIINELKFMYENNEILFTNSQKELIEMIIYFQISFIEIYYYFMILFIIIIPFICIYYRKTIKDLLLIWNDRFDIISYMKIPKFIIISNLFKIVLQTFLVCVMFQLIGYLIIKIIPINVKTQLFQILFNHSNIISTNSMSFGMFALLFFGLFIVGLVTGTIATNVLGNSEKMIHPCYYKNYLFDYTDMIDEATERTNDDSERILNLTVLQTLKEFICNIFAYLLVSIIIWIFPIKFGDCFVQTLKDLLTNNSKIIETELFNSDWLTSILYYGLILIVCLYQFSEFQMSQLSKTYIKHIWILSTYISDCHFLLRNNIKQEIIDNPFIISYLVIYKLNLTNYFHLYFRIILLVNCLLSFLSLPVILLFHFIPFIGYICCYYLK